MAQKQAITIDQGATFSTSFLFLNADGDPIDFTSYTANSQMRKAYSSSTAHDFTVALANSGQITISMSANTTGAITAGRYVYDVEVQDTSGIRTRMVEGIATVTPQVTR
jgi:hypothetical protein